jgi:hypothetical protein
MTVQEALNQVSLSAANFGNAETLADVLSDWIAFLGGRPGEIVLVDGGSSPATHSVCFDLFQKGHIDKLQLIGPNHPDNNKNTCYLQEHAAGAIGSKPYILFFKSDTLPYRNGDDDWLPRALELLDRPDTFAIGGSCNMPVKQHDAPFPGWYFTQKCSLNFALMKRSKFVEAMQEFAGAYIASNFCGISPVPDDGNGSPRYLVEIAFETYIKKHGVFTLAKVEDESWTVFHTNAAGKRLAQVRQDYLARRNITPYLNAGRVVAFHGGCYYGMKRRWIKELRVAFGASRFGPHWRAIKRLFAACS